MLNASEAITPDKRIFMSVRTLEVHPVYGAIPRDGETVEPGDVLGLSPDSTEVVTAPIQGRVRLVNHAAEPSNALLVEIDPGTPAEKPN